MAAPAFVWSDDLEQELIDRLEAGETITSIVEDPRMPSASTLWRWEDAQDDFGERITRARERGYQARADKILARVKACDDPQKGRLEFDAERWYLGKMQPKRFGDRIDVTSGGEKLQREAGETEKFSRLAALMEEKRNAGLLPAPDEE